MRVYLAAAVLALTLVASASAEKYYLLNGVDARHYPGATRMILGPGGVPGEIYDGDRLAGTADIGIEVPYRGTGTPMYPPNYLGSLSMLYRRGTIPFAGGIPILGVEFLGGPLLDLDGDPNNATRSLIPIENVTPVEIPGTDSFLDLGVATCDGTIALADADISGCNEGAPNFGPDITTILVTIAGTQNDGSKTGPINPTVDTRSGTLTAFAGTSGTLGGVYAVDGLGFELWEDSIDPTTSTADALGSMQFLGTLEGWLIVRDATTGQWPVLAGEGLGSTAWPAVNLTAIGQSYVSAISGNPTIFSGAGGDQYVTPGNGGLALADFGGDLGAYLDAVVIAGLPNDAHKLVYLESVGFGINNSNDPVYTDTTAYDAVIIAATLGCAGTVAGDSNCNGTVGFEDINSFVAALLQGECGWLDFAAGTCDFLCANDLNGDGRVGFADINPFVVLLLGNP